MQDIFQRAQIKTVDVIKTDVQDSQTIPFNTGHLQNNTMFVDKSKIKQGIVSIYHEGPYARRLYFHPEYNFKKDNNPKAGGLWFEPYLSGNKKKFAHITFAKFVRKEMGNVISRN